MAQSLSRLIRPALLLIAVLIILGCGSTSTVVVGGATSTPTIATATATPLPTATPTPGHMLVTISPILNCSGTCTPYVCHTGTTCNEHGICTASSWPTFTISNSGGLSVTWNASVGATGSGTPVTGWTISPPGAATGSGTLTGTQTASFTLTDNPSTMTGFPNLVITAPGQTVTVTLGCANG
ncbi:MAG TPA: hypothetical protein VGN32_12795 [Ktedonobacterales bacterium]|nr:hypothetical protein [Ktedonobacterales bacterium]